MTVPKMFTLKNVSMNVTVEVYKCGLWSDALIKTYSSKQAKQILGIRSQTTWRKILRFLGIPRRRLFSEDDLIEAFKLRLFTQALKGGKSCSYRAYSKYSKQPALLKVVFKELGIDLDRELTIFKSKLENNNGNYFTD